MMRHDIVSLGRCSCGWVVSRDAHQGVDPFTGFLTVRMAETAHVLASALFKV